MANPDYEFLDGFDVYGPSNANTASNVSLATRLLTRWTTYNGAPALMYLAPALSGTGYSLYCQGGSSSQDYRLTKALPGNYARFIGGETISSTLAVGSAGTTLYDGGTAQVFIGVNTAGRIEVRRGTYSGTLLATSVESITANSVNYLAYDVTISPSAGIVKVWLNNVLTSINLTGQNTRASANSYVNALENTAAAFGANKKVDHQFFWGYLAAGGSELPPLDSPIIQTDFPSADSAVAFAPIAGVLGGTGAFVGTSTTSAPGANKIILRPYVAEIGGTLGSVTILPGATSASVKLKPVVYANSSGAPGSLLTTGAEVVGMTSGTALNMPVTTPQTLVAGTTYWIGFITDTGVALSLVDDGTAGYNAANTYASGAPGTAPTMTAAQPSYLMYGNVTALAANFAQVNEDPSLGLLSYNSSSTVSAEDLYTFPSLAINANAIYTVAVSGYMARSDTGARTANLRCKSGATESSGSNAGQSPPTSFGWLSSNFKTDPNTGSAWANAAAVNAAKYGAQVAS
jgi:hypothetical protein